MSVIRKEVRRAVAEWEIHSLPRPPMIPLAGLQFAFYWPGLPFFRPRCIACAEAVDEGRLLKHMNDKHPGWLESWNAKLRGTGIVR